MATQDGFVEAALSEGGPRQRFGDFPLTLATARYTPLPP